MLDAEGCNHSISSESNLSANSLVNFLLPFYGKVKPYQYFFCTQYSFFPIRRWSVSAGVIEGWRCGVGGKRRWGEELEADWISQH